MMRFFDIGFPSKRVAALGAAVIAAGAIAGVALAGENAPPDLTSPSPSGQASSVSSELSSSFAILRRSGQPSDALSSAAASGVQTPGGASQHYGVNPSLARLAGSPGGAAIWLVPGSTGSCIALATGGGSCGPNDLLTQQGIVLALVPTSGAPPTVYGVVPDNASVTATDSAGAQSSVPLSGQAFILTAANAASFTIHTPSGTAVTHTLPSTPPPGPPGS